MIYRVFDNIYVGDRACLHSKSECGDKDIIVVAAAALCDSATPQGRYSTILFPDLRDTADCVGWLDAAKIVAPALAGTTKSAVICCEACINRSCYLAACTLSHKYRLSPGEAIMHLKSTHDCLHAHAQKAVKTYVDSINT